MNVEYYQAQNLTQEMDDCIQFLKSEEENFFLELLFNRAISIHGCHHFHLHKDQDIFGAISFTTTTKCKNISCEETDSQVQTARIESKSHTEINGSWNAIRLRLNCISFETLTQY